ncbi:MULTISPECIES: hypothetical protein [Streptococcus]|uniref:Uncharacterized protein n=1 Tax=Streptococcus pantholopis TaxID=1811193 RepID=A0A172Q717_9STRE|nr:hypothetical protein [Streptococcus pantholopis]AND79279.1 hypothetical protein A0O21_04165 [Streptococcus pantholopis]
MALKDQDIQGLQGMVDKWSQIPESDYGRYKAKDGNWYEIVNTQDGTTEAIAVAPVVDGKTDYSQTAIVVAGT